MPNSMDAAERALFKSERERQKLNQVQVAATGGITQGTISKIEIEPDYDPSISVFRSALRGINMTLSSFFARIEGAAVPAVQQRQSPEPSDTGVSDEAANLAQLSAYAGTSRATLAVIDELVRVLVRARTAAEVRRSPSSDRADAPGRPRSGVSHPRPAHRRTRRNRRGKD